MKYDLSKTKGIERLKNSTIKKSKLLCKSDKSILNSKEIIIKNIYRLALQTRSGQFENFQANHEFSNEIFKLVQ